MISIAPLITLISAGKNLKRNHDKLVDKLRSKFGLAQNDANKYILQLREVSPSNKISQVETN